MKQTLANSNTHHESTTMAAPKPRGRPQRGGEKKSTKSGKRTRAALGPNRPKTKKKIGSNQKNVTESKPKVKKPSAMDMCQFPSPTQQRNFLVGQFESANGIKLSSLELESIKDVNFVKLPEGISRDASNLGRHVKDAYGSSWKEALLEGQLVDGKIEPGNPAVLVISASAIRSLEMLRGLRDLSTKCQVVKLFSKHMKVNEQVTMLKSRVNLASGTPSRIKKLCEMEALGLSRLEIVVLDMHTDVKGYSLFTLPQVRDEFWDLYKSYLHPRLIEGNLRVCLYGPIPTGGSKISEEQ